MNTTWNRSPGAGEHIVKRTRSMSEITEENTAITRGNG